MIGLFEPLAINGCTVANRFVMAPMTRGFSPGGLPVPEAVDYYARRAAGGVGLILTEGVAPNAIGAWSRRVPMIATAEQRQRWREVADAVHAAGGRIMMQLWHSGLGRARSASHDPEALSIGPSDRYPEGPGSSDDSFLHGRAMSVAEIEETIEDHVRSAEAAKQAGFDGIEIHAAHGYLIDQFFWPKCNRRCDEFGGGIAGRTRLAVTLICELRRRLGAGYPIGLRFSEWKLPEHYAEKPHADPQALGAFLEPLADAGVDFFDCSTRRFWEPVFAGSDLTLSGWTKKLTGKLVMTVGSIGLDGAMASAEAIGTLAKPVGLDRLNALHDRGEFDLAGVGRALLANPDWVDLVRRGRFADIRPYELGALLKLV